jgi:RNA polymerase sigma factor (TIGR02999 family)
MSDVTQILQAIDQGDPHAPAQLLPLVYDELRKLATAKLAQEKPGQTLEATALVHEAYLRLVGDQQFAHRRHFFAAAAQAMQRILVEQARRKQSLKRGGGSQRVEVQEQDIVCPPPDERLLALDLALEQLAQEQPRLAELVRLRFFAGLAIDEAAEVLAISPRTAKRDWTYARAWLRRAMDTTE